LSGKQPNLKNNCPPRQHSKSCNIISTTKHTSNPHWSDLTLSV